MFLLAMIFTIYTTENRLVTFLIRIDSIHTKQSLYAGLKNTFFLQNVGDFEV